ncbi:TIGR03435 family protein [Granulicella arctica]|uniref:TIGR03435 family protein n=1 Tax=Granulicella arctica TaxID=940613 RepID=UPI0021E0F05A|nr:TIGR03435 family protein [Granulicella arctica]
MCRTFVILCILAFASAFAQSSPSRASPAFDVASVRPSKLNSPAHSNVPLDAGNVYALIGPDETRSAAGGLFIATHQALWRYITFAYKLSGTQELALRFNMFSGAPKSGAPFWVTGSFDAAPEYFDISARAPADTSMDQMRLMMQALLADRFHLTIHNLSANTPVFALVLAKPGFTGPNLQPHSSFDTCGVPTPDLPPHNAAAFVMGELPPVCGVIAHVASSAPGPHYGGRAVPLSLLVTSIPTMTGLAAMPRPVVDQTNLSGLYDFTLNWMHDLTGEEGAVADNAANFRTALKIQLGLELKPSHAPIGFLIIDHVERPSEN